MADGASGPVTRPTLLERIRDKHDNEAWQTFVDIYGPLIYSHARRQGLQDADAAEVTQEVLLRVSRSIQQFEYDKARGRFRDWLGTVTHNRIRSLLLKNAGAVRAAGDTDATEALHAVASVEHDTEWTAEFNRHLLQAALLRCRPHFEEQVWRAFELVWLEDRPAAEVARSLGQKINWVYLAKSRVLKRLEQEVQVLAEDVPRFLR